MDMEKLKQWLDLTQQYQSQQFWKQIFDEEKRQKEGSTPSKNTLSKEAFPKCDLYENNEYLVVEAEIPGLKKEQIQVFLKQLELTISGEFSTLFPKRQYYLKERPNLKFNKTITLPYPVQCDLARFELKEGLLIVFLPFIREKGEEIPIHMEKYPEP